MPCLDTSSGMAKKNPNWEPKTPRDFLFPPLSNYIRHICYPPGVSVLEQVFCGIITSKILCCQHWRYENEIFGTIEKRSEAKELRKNLVEGWEDMEGVLHYQSLLYIPEIICSKIINRHYDDPLASHFGIKMTRKLVARNYFWPTLCWNVKPTKRAMTSVWL